ncbi:MAG: fibronectin type III domain-containing protein [Acidobacteria bacterium]|nr:fibronectin type III domain-containing protein [Acidobacteriota bacterium]
MPNGEDSDGEPFRRLGPEAPDTAPRARRLPHCFIQSIILLLLSFAATPAAAQVILFPRGPSYTVPFTQGDIGDYKLAVAHNGDVVEPSEVLLSVRPVQGSGFVVTPRSGVTTAEFVSVFPLATTLRNSIDRLAAVVRKSDDVVQDSFLLYFTFDASAQFDASSSARHTQLWTKAVNVYEGDAAPAALGFSWTVVGPGGKTWGLGATPYRIRCEVQGVTQGDLSDPAPDNSALFEFDRTPSASNSGEASVRFRSAPDFENPPAAIGAGNVYHVRVYNRHDLRGIDGEGTPTGCTGTALDLVVTVQDVGAPAQVVGVSATQGGNALALSWDAPATDVNGAAFAQLAAAMQVTGYDYRYRTVGAASWTAGTTTDTSVDITVPEASYELQVRAVSAEGSGAWSDVVGVGQQAGPPLNLATAAADGQVTLTWEVPSTTGGFDIQRYEYRVDGAGDWISTGMERRAVVTGLTNGQEYRFEVRAVTAAGSGPSVTMTATPEAVVHPPSVPRNLRATPGDGRVTLSWERPSSDGGSPITDYEYQVNGAGDWTSAGLDLREVVTGLANGRRHSFEVRAINAGGEGPPATAAATPVAPIFPPSAPRNLQASPGDGRVTFSWEPPSNFGGSTITDYECRIVDGSWISTGGDQTEELTGLTNGRQYRFEVRAVNAAGAGPVAGISVRLNAAPSFPHAEYAFELPENLDGSRQGVELGRVTAEDPDGDAPEHALVSGDTALFAVRDQDGALTYIGPGEDFEAEPLEYILTVGARDPEGAEARARVVVTVTAVNEPPTARDDEARTEEDKRVVIDVLDNDTDPDGDPLQVETLSMPEHGAVRVVDGGVAYMPEPDYHGADRFTYVVSDGTGLTATAFVDVTVLAVNDAPEQVEAIPDQELDEGSDTATVELAGFFEDPDGDALTYRATSSDTAVARVTVTAALLTVAPVQSGTATVTVSAEDRDGLTATQAFVVGVSDQLVQAVVGDTLAALGRGHLASARMTLGRRARTGRSEPSRVVVMGKELPLGGAAARTSADRMPASWLPIPGTGSHSPSGGPSGMGAAGSRDGAILVGQGSLDVAWDEALRSSSFALGVQTGDNDTPGGGRAWTFWGQGDAQTFRGARDTRSGYAGQVITGYVGVDTQLTERWLVGVALARSSGDGDWRAGSSRGNLGTTLTTVQPYARWSDGNTSVWTMAGGGRGNIENVRESTVRGETSGLGLALGLVEVRRRMGVVPGGLHLGLRGDLAWARLSTDAGGQTVDGVRAAVHQMRVGVELSRPFRMENGLVLTPFGELHARRDGGAGQTGSGLEVAAGFSTGLGLVLVEAQGRMLAMHSADSYRERGASLTLSVGEGVRRPGLSLSLSPRWGAAASGTDALWQEQLQRHSAAAAAGDERALDARIDYGVRMSGSRLLTPFGAYGQSQFDRRLRFGAQLGTLEDSGNEPLRLELSVQRHMRPGNLTFHQFDILGVVNLRR